MIDRVDDGWIWLERPYVQIIDGYIDRRIKIYVL